MPAKKEGLFSNDPKGKKGKKTSPWVYVAAVGGAGLVYYLYKQHQANAASTNAAAPTSGIDPATGAPYQAGVGSLAGSGPTGTPTDPLQAVDPATGQTYAAELAGANATGQQNAASLAGLQGGLSTLTGDLQFLLGGSPGTLSPSAGSGGNPALDAWRAEKAAVIARAEGISVAQAGQAISQYLQGKPITNAAAAKGLTNVLKNSGPAPTATGHVLPVRVASPKAPARARVVASKTPPARTSVGRRPVRHPTPAKHTAIPHQARP